MRYRFADGWSCRAGRMRKGRQRSNGKLSRMPYFLGLGGRPVRAGHQGDTRMPGEIEHRLNPRRLMMKLPSSFAIQWHSMKWMGEKLRPLQQEISPHDY